MRDKIRYICGYVSSYPTPPAQYRQMAEANDGNEHDCLPAAQVKASSDSSLVVCSFLLLNLQWSDMC